MRTSIHVEELFVTNCTFIEEFVAPSAWNEIKNRIPGLAGNLGYIAVDGFLLPEAEHNLDELTFDTQGDCLDWANNRTATGLLGFMCDVSRLYIDKHPLDAFHTSVKRLSHNPQDSKHNTVVPVHHDWQDGNAVLYNRKVVGSHIYRVGRDELRIKSNQLTILNGDGRFLPRERAYGTPVHSVTLEADQDLSQVSRERYLAFCDGRSTDATMLPEELVW